MKVIGISGKAEHGKTYTCNILRELYEEQGKKVEIVPLALILKEYAFDLGWDGQKDSKGRTLLQDLGKVLKSYHGGDCFARWAYQKALEKDLDIMLVDDMRMLDEVEFFKLMAKTSDTSLDDFKLYRVIRKDYENSLTEEQRNDISETALDNYDFDLYLQNNGTRDYDNFIIELFDEGII